jgi:hypothetical protein
MKFAAGIVALIVVLAAWVVFRPNHAPARVERQSGENAGAVGSEAPRAILVELFTSEGCSSCPPADRLLAELQRDSPVPGAVVIALSEHVDYWNRLGWTDPFSSRLFSDRQSEYARAFASEGVYTPQMVVDGRYEFVGSDRARAAESIRNAAKIAKSGVKIAREAAAAGESSGDVTLMVRVDTLAEAHNDDAGDVMLAITEDGLQSSVVRGENAGRKLPHTAVVRSLSRLGKVDQREGFTASRVVSIDRRWRRSNLRAVAFVQARQSRRVLGAAVASLAE